jgi:AcrR family transcriptional regulator
MDQEHRSGRLPGTADRLLQAAVDLMAERGYHAATTKDIAARAGVNEVTLFRHFGSKQKLLEAAFDRFHYGDEMERLFREGLSGRLRDDLLLISRTYHQLMNRNRNLIRIVLKEGDNLPDRVHERAIRHPQRLLRLLADYLSGMAERGHILPSVRPDLAALSFMWMNYGAFISKLGETTGPDAAVDDFIEESVSWFVRGISP